MAETSDIDWSNDELVVRAAVPDATLQGQIGSSASRVFSETEGAMSDWRDGANWFELAEQGWRAARRWPTVVAFEASHRVTQEGKPNDMCICDHQRCVHNGAAGRFLCMKKDCCCDGFEKAPKTPAAKPLTPDSPKDAFEVTDEDRRLAVRLCNSGGILICGVMAERRVAELLAKERAALSGNRPEGDAKVFALLASLDNLRQHVWDQGMSAPETDFEQAVADVYAKASAIRKEPSRG